LGASLLVGGLFARFGQSPIVGYLLAGMMLGGPGSLHAVSSESEIEAIAELGVALLLFSLGLEFSIARLKKLGAKPLLGGAVQVVLTILLAFAAAKSFGFGVTEAIAFGVMVSLSSTAVVLRILMERGEIEMPHGRNSLGVLLTQDMAVVPLALLLTVLGGGGTAGEIALDIGKLLLMAGGLIAGLFLLTKVAVMSLGTLILHRNRELTVIFAVVTGLGAAWASHAVGISPALREIYCTCTMQQIFRRTISSRLTLLSWQHEVSSFSDRCEAWFDWIAGANLVITGGSRESLFCPTGLYLR
jgi:CPA2 family monovalent cation:H+ antiporter-2